MKKLTRTDCRFCRQKMRMRISASVPTANPIHVRLVRVARTVDPREATSPETTACSVGSDDDPPASTRGADDGPPAEDLTPLEPPCGPGESPDSSCMTG